MKKKTTLDIIMVAIFLGFIYGPFMAHCFFHENNYDLEESEISSFPTFENISTFPKDFENDFINHFPYRSALQNTWSNLNYISFHESTNANVVIGKKDDYDESFLFYSKRKDENPLGDITGLKTYSQKEKEQILKKMTENIEKLKEKNISLYYLLVPNKSSVYKQYLPDTIGFLKEPRLDELDTYLKKNGLNNYIYTKERLIESSQNYPTYYHTDTHWTNYGAYISMVELLNKIDQDYCKEKCQNASFKAYKTTSLKYETMDLKRMLGVSLQLEDMEVEFDNFLENISVNKTEQDYGKYGLQKFESKNALNHKKVLFIGDSFRKGTYDFIPKVFTNVLYVHITDYENSLIKTYNPDIIIYEVVERYSKRLLLDVI